MALQAPAFSPAQAEERSLQSSQFTRSFAVLPEPVRKFSASTGAVDITEIKIPVEIVPPAAQRALANGIASYYGKRFAGRLTANGERFNPSKLTAAHKTLPFGTKLRVTNPGNGKSVIVRINDRGPYAYGRSIDLSRAAAEKIGLITRGHGVVEMVIIGG